jgi:hypothetical protein
MIIHNPILTGSFTYNGADISSLLSSSANITSLNAATASLNTFSASVLTFTGSVNTFTGSANSRLSSLEAATASLYSATSSFSGRVGALESYTASQNIRNTTYATTGSNTLVGTQYISNTNNAIGFSNTTASIYTDGGLQVTKDAYFSSSMFIKGNLTVFGTQSVSFITSSQLNISTNLITVNTSLPSVRFGGLAVQDSGSVNGLTGSLLWDSQDNQWIYSNPSGSEYDSALFLVGPRSTGSLGNEVGITTNALAKGNGAHHMTSSGIFESGSNVGIGTPTPSAKLEVNGYGVANSIMTYVAAKFYGGGNGGVNIGTDGTVAMIATDSSDADMQFLTRVAGVFSPRITIKSGGNVNIGSSAAASYGLLGSSNLATSMGITFHNGSTYSKVGGVVSVQESAGSHALTLWTRSGGDEGERIRITSGGNVGIGITNPGIKFYVSSSDADYAAIIKNTSTSGYGLQVLTAGSNTNLAFQVRTNNATIDAFQVLNNGNIGIGYTAPDFPLAVWGTNISQGDATITAHFIDKTSFAAGVGGGIAFGGYFASSTYANSFAYIQGIKENGTSNDYAGALKFGTRINGSAVTERMRITSTGLVGIGYFNPQAFVDTSGFGNLVVGNGGSGDRGITIYSGTTGRGGLMFADATTGSGGYIGYILYNHSTDTMEFATSSSPRLLIKSDGRTWVGGAMSGFDGSSAIFQINGFSRVQQTIFHNGANVAQAVSVACNGADSLNVAGAFSANSKSFLIPHPLANLESTHNLRYVSVEAPQADLYYRGKLTLVNGRGQANIDEAATMTEGTFEALCREVQCFTTNETGWDLVKGKVIGNIIYIESQNTESTDEISWLVIGERKDKHMMDTSWTDENGKVIVEPLAPEETTII